MKNQNKHIILITILVAFVLAAGAAFFKALFEGKKASDIRLMENNLYFAIRIYTDVYGECPPDLGALWDESFLQNEKCYVSNNSDTPPPKNGADIRKGNCDFLYFGKGIKLEYTGLANPNAPPFLLLAMKPGIYKDYFVYITTNIESRPEVHVSETIPPEILKLMKKLDAGDGKLPSTSLEAKPKNFFALTTPPKALKLDKDLRSYYMRGYKHGWLSVLEAVSVEQFKEKIEQQRKNKGFTGLLVVDGITMVIPGASDKQVATFFDGRSDGQAFANKLLDDALNKHFDDPRILQDFKDLKKEIKKESKRQPVGDF